MTGPRQEIPCGCVLDTIDGEVHWLYACEDHAMGLTQPWSSPLRWVFTRISPEPLSWHLDENDQLVGPFAADGSPR